MNQVKQDAKRASAALLAFVLGIIPACLLFVRVMAWAYEVTK